MYRTLMAALLATMVLSCNKGAGNSGKGGGSRGAMEVECQIASLTQMEITESYAGVLMPYEEVVLRTESAGRITHIGFNEGSLVSKGQLLVKINDDDLQAQLEKVKQQLQLAQSDELRKRELLSMNGISREEYEKAEVLLKTLNAEIDFLKAAIAKTEVRAPFAGVVGLRKISPGAFVNNATEISVLRQTHPLKLEFSVPEKFASSIKIGESVLFSHSGSEMLVSAEIYAYDSGIDMATRTLKVRATVNNSQQQLLAGGFATVRVSTKNDGEVVSLPAKAVVPIVEGESVWLVKNGKALQQKIKTGFRTPTQVVVNGGVVPGDTIVLTGFMQLRNGMAVNVRVVD